METEAPLKPHLPHYPFLTEEEVVETLNLRSGEFRWLQVHRGLRPKKYTDDGATPLFWDGDLEKLGRKPQDWEIHFDMEEYFFYSSNPFAVDSKTAARIIIGKQKFILIRSLATPITEGNRIALFTTKEAEEIDKSNLPYDLHDNQCYGWMQEEYAEVSPGCEPYYKSESDDEGYWADIEACEGNKLEWKPANQMPIENSRVLVEWETPILICPSCLLAADEEFKSNIDWFGYRSLYGALTQGSSNFAEVLRERFGDDLPDAVWFCPLRVVKRLLTNRQLAIIGEPIK